MATNFDFSWLGLNNTDFLSLLSQNASSLDSLYKQSSKNITYSFYTYADQPLGSDYSYIPSGETADFSPFDQTQVNAFQGIVGYLSNLIDLSFTQVSAGTGQVRLGDHNMTPGGYATYPNNSYQHLFLNNTALTDTSGFYIGVLWHEFGHTLGLKHPFESSGSNVILSSEIDTRLLSIMSYSEISTVSGWPMDFAPLDMFELLKLYGPAKQSNGINFSFIGGAGDSNQIFNNNNYSIDLKVGNIFWVYGTRGVDSVDVSQCYKNTSTGVTVDCLVGYIDWDSSPSLSVYPSYSLSDGSGWSTDYNLPVHGNLYFYPSDNINSFQVEKLFLTDKVDTIVNGNEFKEINSMGGDDVFTGFADGLSLDGGSDSDKLIINALSTGFTEVVVVANLSIRLFDIVNNTSMLLTNIESIVFSDKTVLASQLYDTTAPMILSLSPRDGAIAVALDSNVVSTFTEAIQRGIGNIYIHLGSSTGAVVESYDAATSSNISISGSTLTINPTNNLSYNTKYFVTFDSGSVKDLAGNSYADTTTYDFTTLDTIPPIVSTFIPIDGATSVFVNSNIELGFNEPIQRGTGNIYIRSGSATGVVVESYDAATSSNISISGSTLTINPTNNLSYNTKYFVTFDSGSVKDLAGNSYADTTTYDFTTSNTVPTALASYILTTKEPNDLTYIGSSDFAGTGTIKNNIITSSIGNDKLDGGKGIDTLTGGKGNDTYIVDSIKDIVVEEVNSGIDTIQSSVTFSLAALVNVENLTLIGTKAINGTGNNLDNAMLGNSAKNSINGGLGNDILTGGNSADTFQFNTTLNSNTNVDTITDFVHGTDKIQLSRSIMSNLNSGTKLNPSDFVLSTAVLDASDRIIYDQSNGAIYYDADGSGAVAAIQIAIIGVETHATLTATDFILAK
jgi:Ca2+-binding RTX toxin-like protein